MYFLCACWALIFFCCLLFKRKEINSLPEVTASNQVIWLFGYHPGNCSHISTVAPCWPLLLLPVLQTTVQLLSSNAVLITCKSPLCLPFAHQTKLKVLSDTSRPFIRKLSYLCKPVTPRQPRPSNYTQSLSAHSFCLLPMPLWLFFLSKICMKS